MNKKTTVRIVLVLSVVLLAPLSLQAATSVNSQARGKDTVMIQSILSDSQAYKKATEGLIAYFRDVFMKTKLFVDTYGDIEWEDFSEEVADSIDIFRDRKMEKTRYNDKQYAFTGMIFDELYTEISVDKVTGEIKNIVIEFM